MFDAFPLFLAGLTVALTTATQPQFTAQNVPFSPYGKAKVVDILDNDRVLISFGKDQGAERGMWVHVWRVKPQPEYLGRLELVQIGAAYSVGRYGSSFVRVNDEVDPNIFGSAALPKSELEALRRNLENLSNMTAHQSKLFGGAIIDLSNPKKQQ